MNRKNPLAALWCRYMHARWHQWPMRPRLSDPATPGVARCFRCCREWEDKILVPAAVERRGWRRLFRVRYEEAVCE